MKKTTFIPALVLGAAMILTLTACGDSSSGSNAGTVDHAATTAHDAAEPTAPEKISKEQILEYFTQLQTAEAPGLNTYHSSWDDMVAYLTEQGVIPAKAVPVDMLTTEGYLQDNTEGELATYAFADKAMDFDGVYLCWWNLAEPTDALECYIDMKNNGGTVVIMGGAAVTPFTMTDSGSYAIGFAESYDETAVAAALETFNGVENKAYSLNYMTNAVDLAMAFKEKGLLAAADLAANVNLNEKYAYPAMIRDWVGYDVSESGYGDPYETTGYARLATEAYQYGNVTILYFAVSERGEASWYPDTANVYAALSKDGTSVLYCQPELNGDWIEYKANNDGSYDAEGEAVTVTVDGICGSYAIIVND